MIARENEQILDYIIKGATHEQIMKWIGLGEKNYWKRIAAIRKRDIELTKAEQTPEAHAFLYKRTEEKFPHLETMTMQIAESKDEQTRDKIEAMRFLRQLHLARIAFSKMNDFLRDLSRLLTDINEIHRASNGREKEDQVDTFHSNGAAHKKLFNMNDTYPSVLYEDTSGTEE